MAMRMLPSHELSAYYADWHSALATVIEQITVYRDPLTPQQVIELTTLWTHYHALRACGGQLKDHELALMTRLGQETHALAFADMRVQYSQRFAGRLAIYQAKPGDSAEHMDALIALADQNSQAQSHKELALILIADGRFELADSLIRLLPEPAAQATRLRLVEACLKIGDQLSALEYAFSGLPLVSSGTDDATYAFALYAQRIILIAETYLKAGDQSRAIQLLAHTVHWLRYIYTTFHKEIHDIWYLDRKTWYTPMLETIHRVAVIYAHLGRWDEAVQFLHDYPLSILLNRQPLIAQLWTAALEGLTDLATLQRLHQRLPDNLNHGQLQLLIAERALALGDRAIFMDIAALHSGISYYKHATRDLLVKVGEQALATQWIKEPALINAYEMLGRALINDGRAEEALNTAEEEHPSSLLGLIAYYLDTLRASGKSEAAVAYLEQRWLGPAPGQITRERWLSELGTITTNFFKNLDDDERTLYQEWLQNLVPQLLALHKPYLNHAPLAESAILVRDYPLAYSLIRALKSGAIQNNALLRLAQTCLRHPMTEGIAWARRCLLDAHAVLNRLDYDEQHVRLYLREVLRDARHSQLHPGIPSITLQVYLEQHGVMTLVPTDSDVLASYWKNHAPQTFLETWLIALARAQELFEQMQPGLTVQVLESVWQVMSTFSKGWQSCEGE